MSETPARYVTERERQNAQTIAKICWYTGRLSVQRLAWFLEREEAEVEDILGSDEHLSAIEALIRTRPQREPISIEAWWTREWKHKPSAFAKRMKLSEAAASALIEKVLSRP